MYTAGLPCNEEGDFFVCWNKARYQVTPFSLLHKRIIGLKDFKENPWPAFPTDCQTQWSIWQTFSVCKTRLASLTRLVGPCSNIHWQGISKWRKNDIEMSILRMGRCSIDGQVLKRLADRQGAGYSNVIHIFLLLAAFGYANYKDKQMVHKHTR